MKKRESGTGVFLWILWNFQEHLFLRTPLVDWFCTFLKITRNEKWDKMLSWFKLPTKPKEISKPTYFFLNIPVRFHAVRIDVTSEAYWEPCLTSKKMGFAKIVDGFYLFIFLPKRSIVDVSYGSEYVFVTYPKTSQLIYIARIKIYT